MKYLEFTFGDFQLLRLLKELYLGGFHILYSFKDQMDC